MAMPAVSKRRQMNPAAAPELTLLHAQVQKGRLKGYWTELVNCVNELQGEDKRVREQVSSLEDCNKKRVLWRDQMRKFKDENPDNYYMEKVFDRVKEDIARDSKIFTQREAQLNKISRLFFKRFTSN